MFSKYPMISVDQALALIDGAVLEGGSEKISILIAKSRVLYEEIRSPIDFPAFRASTMDGYAVISNETPGTFTVHQSVRAGSGITSLPFGQCAYITTGAAVPEGADAVIPIEEIKFVENSIQIPQCTPHQCIRPIGSDIKQGEIIGEKNDVLTPQHLALIASVGITELSVYKIPIIGVLSTGNELQEIGTILNYGEIIDSNKSMMKMLLDSKCIVKDFGIVKDSFESTRDLMMKMSEECDMIVTSGGVSMGDSDFVKPIIEKHGEVLFGRVNMKPGKPMTFGKIGKCLAFALPGNPVSCFVCFYLFVKYAIDKYVNFEPLPVISVWLESTQKLDPRPEYHRAVVKWDGEKFVAVSTGPQQSSRLLSAVKANVILKFPQATETMKSISGKVQGILIGNFLTTVKTTEHLQAKREKNLKCGVITVSDRAFRGEYEDKTGVIYI